MKLCYTTFLVPKGPGVARRVVVLEEHDDHWIARDALGPDDDWSVVPHPKRYEKAAWDRDSGSSNLRGPHPEETSQTS